ncbi:MAG: Peptidase protein [Cyanobacteriota bacterium erpe_2018_sw_21hr_WHONDRS-SW48-000092_B_bin.40]|jgi:hypothetical protein|nr:Peptidase protein [Cyanobacteriota bacterium erpe_2018_sw_21hr_WHONDRS-SW48-000092_B_bin.40]
MVPLKVCVSEDLAQSLGAVGPEIPHPVEGLGLIDTGAAHSSIDETTIRSLGAVAVGSREYGGAIGIRAHLTYAVTFVFPGDIVYKFPEMGSVQLAENNRPGETPLIALIGRDILANCLLVYNGMTGRAKLTVNKPDGTDLPLDSPSGNTGSSAIHDR